MVKTLNYQVNFKMEYQGVVNQGMVNIPGRRMRPKISLAFIFFIAIMRALPQLGNSLAAFCSSFSDLSLARMQFAPV